MDKEKNVTQDQANAATKPDYGHVAILFDIGLNTLRYRRSRIPAYKHMLDRHREGTDHESKKVVIDVMGTLETNNERVISIERALKWLIHEYPNGIPSESRKEFITTTWTQAG
jgi:hypothetical protein